MTTTKELTTRELGIVEQARYQAVGYAWGLQDMGEHGDTLFALAFGDAYAAAKREFIAEQRYMLPNIRDAYIQWRGTERIGL